ncbi:MAG: response regulator [Candidatus Zixiibacteriota bacterium]
MKIVIADDSNTSRRMLESIIKQWGFEVVSFENGADVWDALKKQTEPSLVILDWVMPGLTGVEICSLLRKHEKGMPSYVILLTACDSKDEVIKGLEAGANDYVTKPFHKEELRARMAVGKRVLELQLGLSHKIQELELSLREIKTLRGIVTICMHCHKMLNDERSWERLEKYVQEHSEAQFSHGLCPECLEKYYPEREESKATQ